MSKKKPNSHILIRTVLSVIFLVMAIIRFWVRISKTEMIIRYGIRTYRAINTIGFICIILFCALFAAVNIRSYLQFRQNIMNEHLEYSKKEARKTGLSVSGKLDSITIQVILSEIQESTDSKELQKMLFLCAQHLCTMDSYQERLSNLLLHNNASNLDANTSQVLEQVEQYMLRTVRKVINYINVCDLQSEEHVSMILSKLSACDEECIKQLNQVQEFLFVMADFLNKQGEDNTTPEKLEIYKNCILDSIREEE